MKLKRKAGRRPWYQKLVYPLGAIFYMLMLVGVLLMKLIMVCWYPLAVAAGVCLGGGKPSWYKYQQIVKKFL